MKVTVLAYDISQNSLGRAFLLAELLKAHYQVEIAGAMTTGDVWEPLREAYDYRGVETSTDLSSYVRNVRDLLTEIDGDVVYASKPRTLSYGTALIGMLRSDRPVIIDIDDWEPGFQLAEATTIRERFAQTHLNPLNVDSYPYTRLCESLVPLADGITVSNEFLRERFGGSIVRHVRNPEQFDPEQYDKAALREELGLPQNEILAVFVGTPHPYKGVSEFVKAANRIDHDDFRAFVVGAGDSPYAESIRQNASDRVVIRGKQPFASMPMWNAAADIVVIPQKRSNNTVGQLPAKLFDALAMGRPVVTTDVSDIPDVVNDAGVVVEPGSVDALADALRRLAMDDELRTDLGKRAREHFLSNYTYDAARPTIKRVVENAVKN